MRGVKRSSRLYCGSLYYYWEYDEAVLKQPPYSTPKTSHFTRTSAMGQRELAKAGIPSSSQKIGDNFIKQATTKCAAFLDEAERIELASIQKRMHSYNKRKTSAGTVAPVFEARSYTFPHGTSPLCYGGS